MQIRLLGEVPSAIPVLAGWFFAEWHEFDGRSRSEIEVLLRHNLSGDALPVTFVALDNTAVIGTVTLDVSDLPHYDHLTPWLASLYVVPSRRRAGIGRALIKHLVTFALERALSPVYLWTPGSTAFTRSVAGESTVQTTIPGDRSRSCDWNVQRVAITVHRESARLCSLPDCCKQLPKLLPVLHCQIPMTLAGPDAAEVRPHYETADGESERPLSVV